MVTAVAAITMLVRPGSRGPQLVTAIGQAFVNAAAGTTGAAFDTSATNSSTTSATAPVYDPNSYNIPAGTAGSRYFV